MQVRSSASNWWPPVPADDLVLRSPQNPKVKDAVKLRNRRHRDRTDRTLIEGYRELRQALTHGIRPESLFYCPEYFLGDNEAELLRLAESAGARLLQTDTRVFDRLSCRERPDGLLGIAPLMGRELAEMPTGAPPFLLIAEAIEKPGNLGAILRSADGAGADGVIVCDRTTDINNPNVVRASIGTLFSVPVAESATVDVLAWLRERGIRSVAATPAATKHHWEVDMTGPIAVVVGSEQYGLTDAWLEAADESVRIPMLGAADSLNVATAATLMVYEVVRQRMAQA